MRIHNGMIQHIQLYHGWVLYLPDFWKTIEIVDMKKACFVYDSFDKCKVLLRVTAFHSDEKAADMRSIFLHSIHADDNDVEIPFPVYAAPYYWKSSEFESLQTLVFQRCFSNGDKKLYCRTIGYWGKNDLLIVEFISKHSAEVTLFSYKYYRSFKKTRCSQ